jgi:Polyketide cyclase / dehydrase and lipid transport
MVTDSTTSSIVIAATRENVLAVIADFAAYPEWATAIRRAEVLCRDAEGRPERVRFTLDAGMIKDSYVLSYQWDGAAQVRWDLAEAGSMISAMSGRYLIAERGTSTEVTYELAVGLKMPMIGMLKRRAEKAIIDTALKGLRTRAEATGGQT